jgi:hypothetical protein
MEVYVQSVLPCSPDAAWAEVQKSSLLIEVARPLVSIRPAGASAFPERWERNQLHLVRSRLFGLIPLGTRILFFDRVDDELREIRTRENDPLVRNWDHVIAVRASSDGRTLYSDRIRIDAGVLTPVVWLFALCFYRHRQRRWQRVAARLRGNGVME